MSGLAATTKMSRSRGSGPGPAGRNRPKLISRRAESFPEKHPSYLPNFWKNRIDRPVPMSLRMFESLVGDQGFPVDLAVELKIIAAVFRG
jgi:hypothetical protein